MVLDGLPGLYGLKYDSATACGLSLYLCSYKLDGSVIAMDHDRLTKAEVEVQLLRDELGASKKTQVELHESLVNATSGIDSAQERLVE